MSAEMALDIWKWRLSWTSSIFSRSFGNDFQEPRGNQSFRHFHMSTISTPYGDLPALDMVCRPKAVGAGLRRLPGAQCRSSVFRVRSHYASARQTAITLCRNGRLFGSNTSPGGFA